MSKSGGAVCADEAGAPETPTSGPMGSNEVPGNAPSQSLSLAAGSVREERTVSECWLMIDRQKVVS